MNKDEVLIMKQNRVLVYLQKEIYNFTTGKKIILPTLPMVSLVNVKNIYNESVKEEHT